MPAAISGVTKAVLLSAQTMIARAEHDADQRQDDPADAVAVREALDDDARP